jgi:hypothetical protein
MKQAAERNERNAAAIPTLQYAPARGSDTFAASSRGLTDEFMAGLARAAEERAAARFQRALDAATQAQTQVRSNI